jgi:hypothetical protein
MESGPSQYKSSTQEERAKRQLARDRERPSVQKALKSNKDIFSRLSQSSQAYLRQKINQDTAQWARSIYDQKLSQNGATNASAQQTSPTFATTQTSAIGAPSGAGIMASVGSSAGASTDSVEDANLPIGSTFGDILYWDPLAGGDDEEEGGGDWVVLPAPEENEEEENELKALTFQNGEIEWNPIEATSSLFHPWKISLRETDGGTEFKVELNSRLYSGLGNWDNIDVAGLNSWSGVSEGYIILFGVVEDGVCTEASIEGPQSTLSDRIDFVDEEQNSFAAQLGYLYQEDDDWRVRQNAFHNFTLMDFCVNAKTAIYPVAT